MELRRIRYDKVYGHLSGDLTLKNGENFLVGINGSGKTTVLNLIRWTLQPSFPDLFTLDHAFIEIGLKHDKYLYTIRSRIQERVHTLTIGTKDKTRDFKAIRTELAVDPKSLREEADIADVRSLYDGVSPEPHELETWRFLNNELPSPVFVGLERHVQERQMAPRTRGRVLSRSLPSTLSPTNKATELIRDAYNTGRQQLVELNEELNRRVLELSFSGIVSQSMLHKKASDRALPTKIGQLKSRFERSSDPSENPKALSDKKVRSAVVRYLKHLETLLASQGSQDDLWVTLNGHNFERASKMFELFEEHEAKAQQVRREIATFTDCVNKFLSDSGKKLSFDENTGNPKFSSGTLDTPLSTSELSSGEAQIVVLLSYFAFLAKTGVPIVIDEPELSLHVEWQRLFVDAVKRVLPPDCQTLMATHSPEICGASDVNVQAISFRRPM